MAYTIKFLTDDEREQAEAFIKLTELGEISCLPNDVYAISNGTFSLFLADKDSFPDYEILNREQVVEYKTKLGDVTEVVDEERNRIINIADVLEDIVEKEQLIDDKLFLLIKKQHRLEELSTRFDGLESKLNDAISKLEIIRQAEKRVLLLEKELMRFENG